MLFDLSISYKVVLGSILWLRDLLIFISHGWQVSNSKEHLEQAYSDENFNRMLMAVLFHGTLYCVSA